MAECACEFLVLPPAEHWSALTGCFAQVGFGFAWREMSQNVFTQDLGPQVLGWQQHLSALLRAASVSVAISDSPSRDLRLWKLRTC